VRVAPAFRQLDPFRVGQFKVDGLQSGQVIRPTNRSDDQLAQKICRRKLELTRFGRAERHRHIGAERGRIDLARVAICA
jgi:hypothetical protein